MMNELEASDLLTELGQTLKKNIPEDSKDMNDGLDFCMKNFLFYYLI